MKNKIDFRKFAKKLKGKKVKYCGIPLNFDFLKPVSTKKVIIAAPVAAIETVDKAHVMADELHILDVKENFFNANHYYENNNIPSQEELVQKINKIILNWK